jgi:hypothetical protein
MPFVSPSSPRQGALAATSSFTVDESNLPPPDANQDAQETQDDAEKDLDPETVLTMLIRSAKYPTPVSVTARKTAKVGKVLEHYLKKVKEDPSKYNIAGTKAGGARKVKIGLSFDGEELHLEAEVGSADAEDEDVWDVIGLAAVG